MEPGHQLDDASRTRAVQRVLAVEMLLNLLVAGAKGVFGLATGSLAIATDAVHSLVDAGANVMAFVAIRMASAPPDPRHPYGHRKFEIVAAMFIGVAVGVAAFEFAWTAIRGLLEGTPAPTTSPLGFVILVGTWGINIFVALYERRRGKQLGSALLVADAAHTATDVFVTATVLASYGAAHAGVTWADPVGALAVVLVISVVAWKILRETLGVLVDQAAVNAEEISAIAMAIDGVHDCHRVRSRGTPLAAHVDLHLQVDGGIPVRDAHHIAHEVEDAIRAGITGVIDVTVHVEPEDDAPESL